jgi:hypothetical protein
MRAPAAAAGAGKTAIAEAAAAAVLARGQRVIYTTPLKALSNQKLYETRARFGAQRCVGFPLELPLPPAAHPPSARLAARQFLPHAVPRLPLPT